MDWNRLQLKEGMKWPQYKRVWQTVSMHLKQGKNWIDRVYPALSFEIIPDETRDLNWNHRFWGHVQFDDIRIIKSS